MNSTAKIFLMSGIILIFLISAYSQGYEWTPVGAFGGQDCDGDSAAEGKFCEPRGIDIGFNETIYVIDTENDRFQVFDSNFTHMETDGELDPDGLELGKFQDPEGIAVRVIDANISYVYITDTRNYRVEIRYQNYTFNNVTNETTVNNSWVEFGQRCYSDCDYDDYIYFDRPKDIEVDAGGTVYVADTEEERIHIIEDGFEAPSFMFDGSDSADGDVSVPEGIAIDSSGNIYVADTGNNKIRIFDSSGVQLRSFGSYGSGQKEFDEPSGIEVDDEGHIFVADRGNHRIQVFGVSGNYMTEFGNETCSAYIYDDEGNISLHMGSFCYPNDIRLDNGKLYVADSGNHRIQVFHVPELPSANVTVDISLRYGWNLFSIPFEP